MMNNSDGVYSKELIERMPEDLFDAAIVSLVSLPPADLDKSYRDLRDKGIVRATDRIHLPFVENVDTVAEIKYQTYFIEKSFRKAAAKVKIPKSTIHVWVQRIGHKIVDRRKGSKKPNRKTKIPATKVVIDDRLSMEQ